MGVQKLQDIHMVILTAGILGLIFFALTCWVVAERNKTKQMLGDGGRKELEIAIRAHANFAEFVPLILILMAFIAGQNISPGFLAVLCGALVLARILHPLGIRILKPNVPRAVGATLTWLVLLACSISAIILSI